MMIILVILALSAQALAVVTAVQALTAGVLNGASRSVAASGLLALVSFVAIVAMELGDHGPRLQHGLGQILQISTGLMFARLHQVVLRLKREGLGAGASHES